MEKHVEDMTKHIHVHHLRSHKAVYFLVVLFVAGLGVIGWGYTQYMGLTNELQTASTTIATITKNYTELKDENDYVKEKLLAEENKNATFSDQIMSLTGTLGTLDKLANTDKQLLQKYSKVYFLNENYIPKKLIDIPADYVYDKTRVQQIDNNVWSFLQAMMADASSSGVKLEIISGYRSFDNQTSLKTSYKVTYGAGTANSFSADQGYSEHQLGTALDFTTTNLGSNFEKFGSDPAYKWLQNNAYRYGFVLSYPPNNAYYQFEPWHWRFVGRKLANMLHIEGQNFYDLDQRKIDSYLVTLFDQN